MFTNRWHTEMAAETLSASGYSFARGIDGITKPQQPKRLVNLVEGEPGS